MMHGQTKIKFIYTSTVLQVKYTIFLSDLKKTLIFSKDFQKMFKYQIS